MTYSELLEKTEIRKHEILKQYRTDKTFKMLADADVNKFACFLYMQFLEDLSDNIEDIMNSADDSWEEKEIYDLYTSYCDNELEYDMLPNEAKITA